MGWSSCDTRRKVAMFTCWNRLINMDDIRLPKSFFKWDVDLGFITSWSKNIAGLFTKLDLAEKFINQQQVSINGVWALLHEDFCKNWEDNIKIMPKLRTYIKFKKVFEVDPYVLSFMSRQRRSYLAQLRNGIFTITTRSRQMDNVLYEKNIIRYANLILIPYTVYRVSTCTLRVQKKVLVLISSLV